MDALLHLSPPVYVITGGVLLFLLLAIFATENVANAVSQLFEIIGRLVNDVATETEAASHTLTGMLSGVLDPHIHSNRQPGSDQKSPQQTGAVTTEMTQSESATAGQNDDKPSIWIAEIIFTRLLYLVTVVVVVGSDFVLAILRLQAVLFPTLPTPVHDLSVLSLLIGGLFVSIVLLTGALTLDFLDVLPKPVRLFPDIKTWQRILLLIISIFSFLLSLIAVGLLFFQGQVLTSLANTNPLGAVALATLIGILQVLVVFLGAWGAIRGLAILLALLGGLIGVVLHLVAVVVGWIGDAFNLLGTVVLRNLILAIAALFGRRAPQFVEPSTTDSALSIVGFGDRSSTFSALLCEEIARMYGSAGLMAAGTYSSEPAVQNAAHDRLVRVGMNDISPLSAHDSEPLHTLKTHLLAIYQRKKAGNKVLLWVVDGERAELSLGTLEPLKREVPDLTITILCLLPPEGIRKSDPRGQIRQLFGKRQQRQGQSEHTITTTIMVDDRSPLYTRYGEPLADRLVARSLSGMLLAPEHHPGNPSFLSVMRGLSEADKPFAALAVDTAGIDTTGGTSEVVNGSSEVARYPKDSGSVSSDVAAERTEEFAGNLLTRSKATTVSAMPNKSDPGVYVNFIVPISTRTQDFATYRGLISKWLADQELYLYGVVEGSGVTIPDSTTTYDRYAQVGVLYPYTPQDAPQGVRELPRPASSDR